MTGIKSKSLKIQISSIRNKILFLSFLLLSFGFFLYHYLISIGFIPPFLGGFFGIVSLGVMPFVFTLSISQIVKSTSLLEKIFIVLSFWILFISITNFILGLPAGYEEEMLQWSLSGLLFNVLFYIIGRMIQFTEIFLKKLLFAFLLMSWIVLTNIGSSGIFNARELADSALRNTIASHQGFARSLIFVLFPLMAFYFKNKKFFIAIFALGLIVLFFNGARTEFVLFIISVYFMLITNVVLNIRKFIIFIATFAILIIGVYFINYLPTNRMIQLLDIENDASFQERSDLTDFSLVEISDNPIFGNYGSYTSFGGVGSYPHNILSAWHNLGLLGFLFYLAIFFILWIYAAKRFKIKKIYSFEYRMFLMFLVATTIGFIFAKEYNYILFGFLVGLYGNLKSKEKANAN